MNYVSKLISKYKSLNIVVKASLWFTICSFIQKGISIITMPIFTRLMSTEEYGRYSIYVSWYNIFIIFMTLNVNRELFNKGLIEHDKNKDEFTTNQMGLLLFLGATFTVLYLLFHNIINSITGLSIFLTSFLILEVISNGIISLWTARKRFSYEYKKIFAVTIILSLLNPIIGIILVLISKYKVEARAISVVIAPFIISIIFLFIFAKRGKLFSNVSWWKKAIFGSIPLLPHYLSLVLLNQSDKLMINKFISSSAAAIYSVAHTAGLLMVLVNEALNNSFVPWAYTKLKQNKSRDIKGMIKPFLYIVLVVNLILIWISPECVKLLAAPEYKEAIYCIVPIAVSVYCTFIYTLFVDVEIYYNGNIFVTIGSILATIINIVLNYIFIPKYGYIAAAYTTLASYFLTMIFHYIFLKVVLKKNNVKQNIFDMKEIFFAFTILSVLSIIALLTFDHYILRYSVILLLFALIILNRKKVVNILKRIKNEKKEGEIVEDTSN